MQHSKCGVSMKPSYDLMLRNALIKNEPLQDIAVRRGRIAKMGSNLPDKGAVEHDLAGHVVLPGFVDSHIHLDKACILCRCKDAGAGLKGAIAAVSQMKSDFTEEDVYQRGRLVIERAITQGTMYMRAHAEVDPRVGLRSFAAMKRLKRDYAFALDLQICVFPQEGLTNDPGASFLLEQALSEGADLLGGCPYTDIAPLEQLTWLFDVAKKFNVDPDLHLDFDLDPVGSLLPELCRLTVQSGWQNRVAVGHATKLAAMNQDDFARHADLLRQSGVAVTALPATDLYLNGRPDGFRSVRGVTPVHLLAAEGITCSVATNNVMNPFTPFGDCSLLRMGNLYANVMHLGPDDFDACLSLITHGPARILGLSNYGIEVGNPADIIVLDAKDYVEAFASLAQPLAGYKAGRQAFERPAPSIIAAPGVSALV